MAGGFDSGFDSGFDIGSEAEAPGRIVVSVAARMSVAVVDPIDRQISIGRYPSAVTVPARQGAYVVPAR